MRLEDIEADPVKCDGFVDYWRAVEQMPKEERTPTKLQELTARLVQEAPNKHKYTGNLQRRYAFGANSAIPFLRVAGLI